MSRRGSRSMPGCTWPRATSSPTRAAPAGAPARTSTGPSSSRGRVAEWYRGTADAVLRNMNIVERSDADTIVILAGDHIYKMDYQPFVQAHRRHRADVTVAVKRVPIGEAHRFGILALGDDDQVVEWQEKPKQPKSDLASLGIYVFSKRALLTWLSDDTPDFG